MVGREVGFALNNGPCQSGLSGPKSAKTGSDRLSFNFRYRVGEYDDRLRPYGRGWLNWFRSINLAAMRPELKSTRPPVPTFF